MPIFFLYKADTLDCNANFPNAVPVNNNIQNAKIKTTVYGHSMNKKLHLSIYAKTIDSLIKVIASKTTYGT